MSSTPDPVGELADRLPLHAVVLDALRRSVAADDRLRWLELGCSLGAGGGEKDSDLDVVVGYAGDLTPEQLDLLGGAIAEALGPTMGVLMHRMDGWPAELVRVAVEYSDGIQLDLVLLPAVWRDGRPDRTVVVVDKDGRLESSWVPPSSQPPDATLAREWMFLGWWAMSAAAKYLKRRSLFEAAEAIAEARKHALQLFAASRHVPYPIYGLVSLLDFPPFELPSNLTSTYCDPSNLASVVSAAEACADLLEDAAQLVSVQIDIEPLSDIAALARERLKQAR